MGNYFFYCYKFDNDNNYVIGLPSHYAQHTEEDTKQCEEDNDRKVGNNMAPRRGKQDKNMAEGTSGSSGNFLFN